MGERKKLEQILNKTENKEQYYNKKNFSVFAEDVESYKTYLRNLGEMK